VPSIEPVDDVPFGSEVRQVHDRHLDGLLDVEPVRDGRRPLRVATTRLIAVGKDD